MSTVLTPIVLTALLLTALATLTGVCGQVVASQTVTKLTRDVNQLKQLGSKMYADFEAAKQHKGPFGKVVSDVKQHKHKLRQVSWQIHNALATNSIFSFIERMVLQFHRIQCEKIGEIFDWIVMEVAGHQVGITELSTSPLQFSESIEIANNVAHYKFVHIVSAANETNRLIVSAVNRMLNGTKVTKGSKAQINDKLESLINDAASARSDLSKEYLNEVAKYIEMKKEMNLVQKMQVEKFIDALQFVAQYVRAYQRMLTRLIK